MVCMWEQEGQKGEIGKEMENVTRNVVVSVFSLSVLCVKLEDDCESVLYFPRYLLHVQQAIAMCV